MPSDAYDKPLQAVPFEGCVIIEGPAPRPVAVALTPEAALATARKIAEAARAAIRDGDQSAPFEQAAD